MNVSDMRLLVVDDHEFQRRSVSRMLRELGVAGVEEASDGRAALAALREAAVPHDIVVSDLDMPDIDGMELMRLIGESGRPTAVILTSALDPGLLASVGTMTRAYGVELLGVVAKPPTADGLRRLVEARAARADDRRPAPPGRASAFPADDVARGLAAGEFEPWFQPKVDLVTGRVSGIEALARWRHPAHGIVGPDAFLPAIERLGLVDELTWTIVARSAQACERWRRNGLDATVAFNVAPSTLADPQAAARIDGLLRMAGLAASNAILEVTETGAVSDLARTLENLARLRIRGFGLSIDDYGTGYSSMRQLSLMPFTELKIDRSFVSGAPGDGKRRVMVENSVRLASGLGLKSVAEGVETLAEWNMLRAAGCQVAQGYFIARPMEADSLAAWALQWRAPGFGLEDAA